jgi:circadian clock protein KaiC
MDRISTGVAGLDATLNGGLPAGSTCVVTGSAGAGKTALVLQFAYEGASRGETSIFLVTDEKPRHLSEKAAALHGDLDPERVRVLDASPYLTAARGGRVQDPRMLVADLLQQIKTTRATRLVIDGLATLVPDEVAVRPFVRSLFRSLEDNLGCTSLVTINPEAAPPMVAGLAESLASAVLHLGHAPGGGRTMLLRKARFVDAEPRPLPFRLQAGHGLTMDDPGHHPSAKRAVASVS